MKRFAGLASICLSTSMAFGGMLAGWDLAGYPSTPIPVAATSTVTDANVNPGVITRGAGLAATGGTNGYAASSWTLPLASTSDDAVLSNDYFSVLLTGKAGATFDVTNFSARFARSATGPTNMAVRTSADNFTANLATWPISGSGDSVHQIALALTGLTNLEVRVYGFASSGAGGTARFTDGSSFGGVAGIDIALMGVSTPGANTPPTITPIGNKVTTNNQALVFNVIALDQADGDSIYLSASNLPPGAVFTPASNPGGITNTFTWNPAGPPGVYTNTFYASDDDGVATETITITVRDPPSITITSPVTTVAYSNTTVGIGGIASTNVNGQFVWTNTANGANGTIPASSAWSISGIPLNVGGNVIVVRGSNSFSETTSDSVTITRQQPEGFGCANLIYFQGFELADTWSILQGAANISFDPGANDSHPNQRILSGINSWQVNAQNVTLELAQVSMVGYTGREVRVRVSSTSTNAGAGGADVGDNIRVFVALDGAAFAPNNQMDIFLKGNNNARWGYWATGTIHTLAGTIASNQAISGVSTSNPSYFSVILPDTATSVALRVWALNDGLDEFWNVDDISLVGCPIGGPPPVDTDGDGLSDLDEINIYGTDPLNPDSDGDGQSDGDEVVAGTDPNNPSSHFKVVTTTFSAAGPIRLDWPVKTNRLYNIERADAPTNNAPYDPYVTNISVSADGVYQTNLPATAPQGTFRIRVWKP